MPPVVPLLQPGQPPGSAGNNARDTDIPRPGCESEHGNAGIRPSPMSS